MGDCRAHSFGRRRVSRARWCRESAPVRFRVRCGTDEHQLEWRAGRLRSIDHDLTAEAVFVALGGRRCECLKLFGALRARRVDELPHTLRNLIETAQVRRAELSPPEPHWPQRTALSNARDHPEEDDEQLAFGSANDCAEPRRIAAATVRHAQLAADAALEHTLQHGIFPYRPGPRRHITVWTPAIRRGSMTPNAAGIITPEGILLRVHLRPTWVRDIWANGFATPSGAFVLDLIEPHRDGTPPRVRYIAWQTSSRNRKHATATIQRGLLIRTARTWHLEPETQHGRKHAERSRLQRT